MYCQRVMHVMLESIALVHLLLLTNLRICLAGNLAENMNQLSPSEVQDVRVHHWEPLEQAVDSIATIIPSIVQLARGHVFHKFVSGRESGFGNCVLGPIGY